MEGFFLDVAPSGGSKKSLKRGSSKLQLLSALESEPQKQPDPFSIFSPRGPLDRVKSQEKAPPMSPRAAMLRTVSFLARKGEINLDEKHTLKDMVLKGDDKSTSILSQLQKAPDSELAPNAVRGLKRLVENEQQDDWFSDLATKRSGPGLTKTEEVQEDDIEALFGLNVNVPPKQPQPPPTVTPPPSPERKRPQKLDVSGTPIERGRFLPWSPRSVALAGTATVDDESGTLSDTLLLKEKGGLFVQWRPRYVSLHEQYLLVHNSKAEYDRDEDPIKIVTITPSFRLEDMKMRQKKKRRLFYRKMIDSKPPHQTFKFGTYSQGAFELWTKALRRVLDKVTSDEERTGNLVDVTAPRRLESVEGSGRQGCRVAKIYLLDGSAIGTVVTQDTTVGQMCVSLRNQLGLHHDAAFSIFAVDEGMYRLLQDDDIFVDQEQLNHLGRFVYRRRVFMPGMAVEEEEKQATSSSDAAIRLAYAEACHNISKGFYSLAQDGLMMACALQLQAQTPYNRIVHRHGMIKDRIAGMIPSNDKPASLDRFEAGVLVLFSQLAKENRLACQHKLLQIVKQLPQYGGLFFRCHIQVGKKTADRFSTQKIPVLVAINSLGVHFKQLTSLTSPWQLHRLTNIERWCVDRAACLLVYTWQQRLIFVSTAQFEELERMLHMYVFEVMTVREKRAQKTRREDEHSDAAIVDTMLLEKEAQVGLPPEWRALADPITGTILYWNSKTFASVFERPKE